MAVVGSGARRDRSGDRAAHLALRRANAISSSNSSPGSSGRERRRCGEIQPGIAYRSSAASKNAGHSAIDPTRAESSSAASTRSACAAPGSDRPLRSAERQRNRRIHEGQYNDALYNLGDRTKARPIGNRSCSPRRLKSSTRATARTVSPTRSARSRTRSARWRSKVKRLPTERGDLS